jgi:hypothetical protein
MYGVQQVFQCKLNTKGTPGGVYFWVEINIGFGGEFGSITVPDRLNFFNLPFLQKLK